MRYGSQIRGFLSPINVETAGLTNPGEAYELHIYTQEPFDADDVTIINQLYVLEQKYPDLKLQHVDVGDCRQKIKVQFKDAGPGQISLVGAISLIPHLFVMIGIIVAGVMLWSILQTAHPLLVWLAILSGGVIVFYYFIGAKIPKPTEVRRATASRVQHTVESEEAALDRLRKSVNDETRIAKTRLDINKDKTTEAKKAKDQELLKTLAAERKAIEEELVTSGQTLREIRDLETELAKVKIEKIKKKR